MKDLLGGKGAASPRLPPRSARAARLHHQHRSVPALTSPRQRPGCLAAEVTEHLERLEEANGQDACRLRPTRFAVTSGGGGRRQVPMPVIMETVLNIGLSDSSCRAGQAMRHERFPRGTPTAG